MAISRRTLQRAIREYQSWLEIIGSMEGRAAVIAGRLVSEYAEGIVRAVAAGTFPEGVAVRTDAELSRVLAGVNAELETMLGRQRELYREAAVQLARLSGEQVRATYGVFGRSSVGRLEAVRTSFQRELPGLFNKGFRGWVGRFQEQGTALRGIMEREITRGQLMGWGQRELSNALLQHPEFNFANLPKVGTKGMNIFTRGGALGEADALKIRANMIARTELNAVQNTMHMAWTQAAGFEKYINVNPLDERTSSICAEASAEPAMTKEEWLEWGARRGFPGQPPRHPNERSLLFAVPLDAEAVTGLPEGVTISERTNRTGRRVFAPVDNP